MFERFTRSFELAKSSWNVLRTDKKLVIFPVISGFATLLVLASFIVPVVVLAVGGHVDFKWAEQGQQPPPWIYAYLFAFYFSTYFVIIFCNAALVSCALMRFNGQEPTLGDGFASAAARLPQILAWALVSATVGVILKVIENLHEKVGEIVSAVLGTAWSVLTYFVVPVLVVEKVGPFQAIARSVAVLRKAWGEALIGGAGLGFFKLLLALPGVALLVAGIYLASAFQPIAVGLVVLALGVLYLLGMSAVGAALDSIFLSALYQYAAYDQVPVGFDRESMVGAFQTRKSA